MFCELGVEGHVVICRIAIGSQGMNNTPAAAVTPIHGVSRLIDCRRTRAPIATMTKCVKMMNGKA
jgi:hypothetical protein